MNFLDPRLPERFWSKVHPEPNSGCWLWTASTNGVGYGQIKRSGKRTNALAHRMAYEAIHGGIPSGLELDHRVCRNQLCCNPAHVEAVTSAVNARRAVAVREVKTHCKSGHLFDAENTYHGRRSRQCKACRRAIDRKRKGAK